MGFFGFGKKEKDKMKTGLEKTRTGFWGSIMNTLTGSVIDDDMYDELEEKLILADVGGEVAIKLDCCPTIEEALEKNPCANQSGWNRACFRKRQKKNAAAETERMGRSMSCQTQAIHK